MGLSYENVLIRGTVSNCPCVCARFILRARAVITFILRAASTLESKTGKQQYFATFPLTAILFQFPTLFSFFVIVK